MPTFQTPLLAALALLPFFAQAQTTTLTQAGYTGLGITPNAHVIGWGRFEATYDNQLPGVVTDPTGHNFVGGFGLLPNLEFSVRIAANNLNANCFSEGCGIRDLSASAKGAIGLDAAGRFRIGAGATDVGGAATNFRTYYGVLTYNEGPVELSAGLARRSNVRTNRSPLHGPFAAAAWAPLPLVRGHIEYADGNAWAGVRLFAPNGWLPEGWSAHVGANQRLTDTRLTQRSWWTAGISIPLFKVPDLPGDRAKAPLPPLARPQLPAPVYEARTLPPAGLPAPPPPVPAAPPAAASAPAPADAAATPAQLDALAAELQAKGLEDIYVGRMPDGSIALRANNASYNWNTADAIGAALGAVARTLGGTRSAYRLVLTQRQVPLVAVTGQANCLRDWIANEAPTCTAGQLSTPGALALEPLLEGASWQVSNLQPSWKTLRLRLAPVLRTNEATELGVLDYSLGVNAGLEQPLWSGARIEWRRNIPVANTSDYDPAGAFGPDRVRSENERLTLTQTLRLPLERWLAPGDDNKARRWGLAGVAAQGTVGRIGSHFDGALGSLRWEPGEGRHRLTAQAGWFRNSKFGAVLEAPGPRHARPFLASYRYNVAPTRTYVEGTAGQFMNNDLGFQVGLRQWFSDVSVGVYYRRTRFQGSSAVQVASVELSVPIGPRREMAPAWHVQVTGTPRFTHGVETVVREPINRVVRGFGVIPPAPSLEETFNSDRSGLTYFEDNVGRIRDAAR